LGRVLRLGSVSWFGVAASRSRLPDSASHLSSFAGVAVVGLIAVFAGLFVGVLLAMEFRRRDLAWTWGLLTLALPAAFTCLVVAGGFGFRWVVAGVAVVLGLSAGALGWGLYWHLEDHRSGGDLKSAARQRRKIFDPFYRRLSERRGKDEMLRSELPVGRTARGELARVPRGSSQSGCHVLIPGATGAGKTTSLGALLVEYVVRSGFGAVVLEAKIDASLYAAAEGAAAARGVPLRLVTAVGPNGYDPLAHGSVDERSERLVSAQTWGSDDADFYRQAASPFLRLLLRALVAAGKPVTLATVAQHCDPDGLENLTTSIEDDELMVEVVHAVGGLRADERRAIAGLRARLQNLASSEFARAWLDPQRVGVHSVDLREAVARKEVVYFRFDTDRTGNVGRAIAQMVLLDLGAAASAQMGAGVGTFVAIDEFGALEAPALERLYARGRAAGFSVAVGTQTLADLRAAGPAVRERVGATVSAVLCHRIGGQADAEWMAQLIGAVPAWQSTIRTNRWGMPSEEGTRTRGYRFEVNPAELQRLAAGEAYVVSLQKTQDRRSARARVVPAWERLSVKSGR
jgi:hypothetical protein